MFVIRNGLLHFGIILNLITFTTGDARFEMKFVRFSNPSGKEAGGNCCDSITSSNCGRLFDSDCDPALLICLEEPDATWYLGNKCEWSKEYEDKNTFEFDGYLNHGIQNPIYRDAKTWPGNVQVSVKVEDVDGNDNGIIGPKKTETFFSNRADRNETSSAWKPFEFTWHHAGGTVWLTTYARVYCLANFYGADCGVACIQGNTDDRGHYTCDPDTGAKICLEHYYGPECKTKCIPRDNYSGHYNCSDEGRKICHTGWQGDHCNEDVNECAAESGSPCSPNGNCTNLEGAYKCECQPEYTGTHCNEIKHFCEENPCSNNTLYCNNTFGGYECTCKQFWRGRHCELPPYCHSSPCGNNSKSCNNTFDGYECLCEEHWRGRHCELPPYCYSSPCSETGVCSDTDDGYVCLCQEGWQGHDCSEKITPCTSLPCLNDGICNVDGNGYNCTCVGTWEGPECDMEIKEIFYGNRTMLITRRLTEEEENAFSIYVKELLTATGYPNCTVDIESILATGGKVSVLITVSSHNPDIDRALQDIPHSILGEELPLHIITEPATQPVPVTQPIVAPKLNPWVKQHWYVILLTVLALVVAIAGLVAASYILKKRRHKASYEDTPVHNVNGVSRDSGGGFDNNVYYEIGRDAVNVQPNGKSYA